MKKICVILLAICLSASVFADTNKDFNKCKSTLEYQGYTDVVCVGQCTFCCNEDDTHSIAFKCKDKNGKQLKGCFCVGVNATAIAWN